MIQKNKKRGRPKKTTKKDVSLNLNKNESEALSLEVDNLLIDEQIYYSQQLDKELKRNQDKIKPVINELDEIIYGQVDSDQIIKPQQSEKQVTNRNSINISYSNRAKNKSSVNFQSLNNSLYTLDLSKGKKAKSKLNKSDHLFKEFRIESSKLEIPKPSLIKRNFFKDNLAVVVDFFKPKPRIKKRKVESPSAPIDLRWQNLKTALNFALIALLIVLPIRGIYLYDRVVKTKGQVLGATEEAFNEFEQAVEAISFSDWNSASINFSQASSYFSQAQDVLLQYNQSLVEFLESLPVAGKKVADSKKLLESGELISSAATNFSVTFASLNKSDDLENAIADSLPQVRESLHSTIIDLESALKLFSEIDHSSLPSEYQKSFEQIQNRLPELLESLNVVNQLIDSTFAILGYDFPKRYLFLFQNNNELRGTGGFLGSFALVDVDDGKIANMEVPGGGLYDLKHDFLEKIISPQPMHLLGTPWMPWDHNWWPDFPTSAQKLLWSFEKSGWPTYDGVIAINATVLPKILEVVGNIELPAYNQLLTPDNVILALQHEAEFEYDREENRPKKIIGDLLPVLIDRLLDIPTDQLLPTLLTFNESFSKKDIQLFFTKENLQNQAQKFGWTGELKDYEKDYLMVVRTNIAGGKTDLVIDQNIQHFSYIQEDGSLVNTAAITLTHNGNPEDVFERVRNNSYIRVYVPLGSQLIEATGYDVIDPELFKEVYPGFKQDGDLLRISGLPLIEAKSNTSINNEFGKTVFGNWLQLDVGESKTLTFSYELPFRLNFVEDANEFEKFLGSIGFRDSLAQDTYNLLVQNQSGVINSSFESRLYLPENMDLEWYNSSTNKGMEVGDIFLKFETALDKDYSYGALISK